MENRETYITNIADIILKQLNLNKIEVWAWGSKDFYCIERAIDEIRCPALMFSIRTPKILRGGRIIISYREGSDEYTIEAIRKHGDKEIPIGRIDEVYADQLHSSINSLIEDKESYNKVFFH